MELCILAECYQAEVAVSDVQTGRIDVYGQGCGYAQRVYLLFTGIHFDAVFFDHVSLSCSGNLILFCLWKETIK